MTLVAAANLVPALVGVITLPIMARGLGVSGRGDVAAGTAPLLLLSIGLTLGLPETVTYLSARHPELLRAAAARGFRWLSLVGLGGTGLVCALAGVLAPGSAGLQHLIILGGLALIPTFWLTLVRACAAGLHAWRLVAMEQVLGAIARLSALIVLLSIGRLTPTTGVIVVAASPLCGLAAYLPLLRMIPERSRLTRDLRLELNGMRSYGGRIWLGAISGILLARLDQTIMTPLSSAHELGLYAVAVNVGEVALIVNSAVRDVSFSSDASSANSARLASSARASGAVSLVLAAIIVGPMPWWLPALFGAGFRQAIPACVIIALAMALGTPGSVAGAGLSARGHPGLRSASLTAGCAINVIAIVALVPRFGATGAAAATLIGSLVASNGSIILVTRITELTYLDFWGVRRHEWRTLARLIAKQRNAFALRSGA